MRTYVVVYKDDTPDETVKCDRVNPPQTLEYPFFEFFEMTETTPKLVLTVAAEYVKRLQLMNC